MFRFGLGANRSLRLFEEGDAETLYALIEANRVHLAKWLPWAEHQTLDGTRAFIRMSRKQIADNDGFQAAVLEGERIIGSIGFHRVDWLHRSTGIGYWLAADALREGTMTLAVSALLDFAFEAWRLNRVEIQAAVGNGRSRAIPERLGFREEGTLRQAEFVGGRFLDHVVYSMLAEEWGSRTAVPSKAPARRSDSASSARSIE
ncbi:MAG: GNAT family N-acetyltransferase [Solirubrobacteraceae bacterium]